MSAIVHFIVVYIPWLIALSAQFQFLLLSADEHFFYNSEYLARFSACPESKKSSVPGHAYFNKISAFMKAHVQVGEIYLEYVKGICQRNEGI